VNDERQDAHRASKLVSELGRSASGEPQTAHDGPVDGGTAGEGEREVDSPGWATGGTGGAAVGRRAGVSPPSCMIVNVRPHSEQVPWRTRAVRSTNPASAPQSGHEFSMVPQEGYGRLIS